MVKDGGKQGPDPVKPKFIDKLKNIPKAIANEIREIRDEIKEILQAGKELIITLAAGVIILSDFILDLLEWSFYKIIVKIFRRYHQLMVFLQEHRKVIGKNALFFIIATIIVVALFSSVMDYQYAYNGRVLGIVDEEKDVLDVLDLISEELSIEYGSNIVINPEEDITFTRIISLGKKIDTPDDVLNKLSNMGDIQAAAFAIEVDGKQICIVESKRVADEVLDTLKRDYLKKAEEKYEYIGFVEDVKIVEVNTVLSNINSMSGALKAMRASGVIEEEYTVVSGDTEESICKMFGIELTDLIDLNPFLDDEDVELKHGDVLNIKYEKSTLTVETIEISTFAEAVKFDTEYRDSDAYFEGEEIVTRNGTNGKARVTARLTKRNGETVAREDIVSTIIIEPVSKVVLRGTKKVPPKKGTGTFSRPVYVDVYRGYGMRWGRMHDGLDYAASVGTPIHAADGGTVLAVGYNGAYGLRVTIDHGAGFKTLYAHCSKVYVKVGDEVYKGQTIAAVGNTGRSTGPHCHFEIFKNGKNVNPSDYV